MLTACVIFCWLEEPSDSSSTGRESHDSAEGWWTAPPVCTHWRGTVGKRKADYEIRILEVKVTWVWKIMKSPASAFLWLNHICCVCQRCFRADNCILTSLNAKAVAFYTLISLTRWLGQVLCAISDFWYWQLGMQCFCKSKKSLFTSFLICDIMQLGWPGTHGPPVPISRVWDYRVAPSDPPILVTALLSLFLLRIQCNRHVSFDQDDTGHQAGSSHSRTRSQCHAL